MRYKENEDIRKADWRDIAVKTSAAMFLKNGIEPVAMTDIAEKCDIGVATLYRYFGTKAEMVVDAGTVIWKDMMIMFSDIYDSPEYREMKGIEQLDRLLGFYLSLYSEHADFMRFVHQFDRYVLDKKISAESLSEYQKSVLDIYPLFEKAYKKACKEGDARKKLPLKQIYLTSTHALMTMSSKFLEGDIIPEDSAEDKTGEIKQIIDMILYYIKAKPVCS